jgi:hypothetical protein
MFVWSNCYLQILDFTEKMPKTGTQSMRVEERKLYLVDTWAPGSDPPETMDEVPRPLKTLREL